PELKIYYRKVEGARELIEKLFECGYKVGILTDPITSESAVLMRMKWVGVSGFPYCIITTGENMHAIKPHPEYFREALSRCGARPENSVLIGDDTRRDIAGAKNFGMRAILIKGSEFSQRDAPAQPDAVVSNFAELRRALEDLGVKIR
ncbi:MAG: HAD family hydrolase, partial [Candidatus Baldrarchaeia archaeon]